MMQNKLFNLIIAVVGAVAIWFFTVLVINPEIGKNFRNVSLEIINENDLKANDLLISNISTRNFEVNVKGKRQDILSLNETDITASIDVLGLKKGKHILVPTFTEFKNIAIESFSPLEVIIDIEKLVRKTTPVKVLLKNKDNNYTYEVESVNIKNIVALGTTEKIKKLDAFVVNVNLLGVKSDKEWTLTPIPVTSKNKQISEIESDINLIAVKVKITKKKKTVKN